MAEVVLSVAGLSKSFGGVHAVRDLSFDISRGDILGLIGPNGSGKSTTVNVLSGRIGPWALHRTGRSSRALPNSD